MPDPDRIACNAPESTTPSPSGPPRPAEREAAIAVLERGTTPPPDQRTLDAQERERLQTLALELGRAVDA